MPKVRIGYCIKIPITFQVIHISYKVKRVKHYFAVGLIICYMTCQSWDWRLLSLTTTFFSAYSVVRY